MGCSITSHQFWIPPITVETPKSGENLGWIRCHQFCFTVQRGEVKMAPEASTIMNNGHFTDQWAIDGIYFRGNISRNGSPIHRPPNDHKWDEYIELYIHEIWYFIILHHILSYLVYLWMGLMKWGVQHIPTKKWNVQWIQWTTHPPQHEKHPLNETVCFYPLLNSWFFGRMSNIAGKGLLVNWWLAVGLL